MATANDMIKRSMRLIGALGQSESPTADEANDGLDALNTMLDSWSIERLFVYQIKQENFTWTGGQSSRTIGSGGNFATTRPNKLENGFTRIDNVDYPYIVVDKEHYDRIPDKTTQSTYPDVIYYQQENPIGTLFAYPIPSTSVDFYINSWKPLQSFVALTTDIALPAGYQRAIEFNLAEEFGPEFGLPVPAWVSDKARESKGAIKRLNKPSLIAQTEIAIAAEGTFNIYRGD